MSLPDARKLQIFAVVAQQGSFSKAAKVLHMAQPAVSIAVAKLEEFLGVELFERQGRSIKLTAEGYETLQRSRNILTELKDLQHHIQEMGKLSHGELQIACPSMFGDYYLADVLQAFLSQFPGIEAAVRQAGTRTIEQLLLKDEIELGVIIMDKNNPQLEMIPLVEQHLVAALSKRHPWHGRTRLHVRDFCRTPLALYQSDYFVRQAFDQLCERFQVQADIRLESNSLPLLTHMVKKGIGNTVALSMMKDQEPEIQCVPLSPRVNFQMGIAFKRGRTLSRANRAFLEWLVA